ncbi:MAG: ATP-binding protein [Planctomycetota bacterium]
MAKVILVSHRPALLRGLVLGVFGDVVEIDTAPDLTSLLRASAVEAAQLLVVDAPALRESDLAAVEMYRSTHPDSRLLLIFAIEARQLAARALTQGFDAYLLEPFTLEEFASVSKRLLGRVLQSSEQTVSERMDVLSVFLRGLAHEILNPLTTVSGILQLLSTPGPVEESPAEVHKRYAIMLEAVHRIGTILKELEFFVRVRRPERGLLTVNELITELATRIKQINPPILLAIDESLPQQPRLLVDREQMIFALTNLCKYAGRLTSGEQVRVTVRRFDRGRIEIEVAGKGTPAFPQDLDRIFVPFYSRTGRDFAQGLSLSAAYGIVRSHNGIVRVEKQGDEGFRFSVLLPTGENELRRET